MTDIPEDARKLALEACDACGITPYSDMRVHAEHVAVAAILADREARGDGWMPIETAPKDWSTVLLYDPEYDDDFRMVFEGYFSHADGGHSCWLDAGHTKINPTHWRPLPSPPAEGNT